MGPVACADQRRHRRNTFRDSSSRAAHPSHLLLLIATSSRVEYTLGLAFIRMAAVPAQGSLRVAVLYTGRFYGDRTPAAWVRNHLQNLIVPNNASVFVAIDPMNWCHRPESLTDDMIRSQTSDALLALESQVNIVFEGWPHVRTALLPDDSLPSFKGMMDNASSQLRQLTGRSCRHTTRDMMGIWHRQMLNFARAEEMRVASQQEHHLVIRMRFDLRLEVLPQLWRHNLSDTIIFAHATEK